jgi:hypothetical protein
MAVEGHLKWSTSFLSNSDEIHSFGYGFIPWLLAYALALPFFHEFMLVLAFVFMGFRVSAYLNETSKKDLPSCLVRQPHYYLLGCGAAEAAAYYLPKFFAVMF